jgi:HK97 family phage prohead protease
MMKFEFRDMDSKTGRFTGFASTTTKDSYGTIFEPRAFKKTIKETRGQVPILFMHDPRFPVGLSDTLEAQEDGLYTEGTIDTDTELGQRVFSGMLKRYISQLSIGFERLKEKFDRARNATIITEVRLLEYSVITKGFASNPDANITSVRSLIDGLDVQEVRRAINTMYTLENLIEKYEAEERAVSGSTSLPIADKGHSWDAGEAEKRIFSWAGGDNFSPSKAKEAFFYYDPANPQNKTAYKLPFADVISGRLTAIPKAISAVKGALNGARGGVDIPESDKKAIMKKVEMYENKINARSVEPAQTTQQRIEPALSTQHVTLLAEQLKKYMKG